MKMVAGLRPSIGPTILQIISQLGDPDSDKRMKGAKELAALSEKGNLLSHVIWRC
jgi:hypothetical protein